MAPQSSGLTRVPDPATDRTVTPPVPGALAGGPGGVARIPVRFFGPKVALKTKRPVGVTVIAVLTFAGAAILAAGSFGFFFVAVMGITSGDSGDPVSVAIAGMGVAGGFSLLVMAGVAACLAIGVLKLREWARIVSIATIAVGIGCTIMSAFVFLGYRVVPLAPMFLCDVLILATAAWMLSYLARPEIKRAFHTVTA